MDIGVEMSLYPLNQDYIPAIQNFIDRLNADGRFKIITNSLSTQVFGNYDDVFNLIVKEMRATFEQGDKAIFVMKVVGPWTPA
jgi:uncharacterized protein YqgV (UPF0045/DUF77 family)